MNTSILIDVIGPVMRGPSSSHTAASFHLSALARSLLGEEPAWAEFVFDNDGSYAQCYRTQGSDLAFTVGLLGWPITDERFSQRWNWHPPWGCRSAFAWTDSQSRIIPMLSRSVYAAATAPGCI